MKILLLLLAAQFAGAVEQPAVTSTETAEHYVWGNCCDGWYLVKTADLNVIQERMPAGSSETLHKHAKARQFFFVLAGQASIERDGVVSTVRAGQGLEVPPGVAHKVANRSGEKLEILVTSQPPSHDDRIDLEPVKK
jgi:mannose-6-phosphate isomerase-like protein (cupin superfamily)